VVAWGRYRVLHGLEVATTMITLALARLREWFFLSLKRSLRIADSSFNGCKVVIFVTDFPYVGISKERFQGLVESYTPMHRNSGCAIHREPTGETLLVTVDEDVSLHGTHVSKIVLTPRFSGYPLLRLLFPWPWGSAVCNAYVEPMESKKVERRPAFIAGVRMIKKT